MKKAFSSRSFFVDVKSNESGLTKAQVENSLESQQPAVAAPPLAGPTAAAVGLPGPGPQLMLGSVQDEELKKLLMSWYYAGTLCWVWREKLFSPPFSFEDKHEWPPDLRLRSLGYYTGLYEGKQKALQEHAQE